MSADTLTQPGLAGDDGSGNEAHWRQWSASIDGTEAYVLEDVGRRNILAGRAALSSFAEDFHTDRIMPRRMSGAAIRQLIIGPDDYIG